jgi:hypothetical protein
VAEKALSHLRKSNCYKEPALVEGIRGSMSTSAKTKSPSLNLFSLLYPQTQKNEIEVSLKYGIALLFQSVL